MFENPFSFRAEFDRPLYRVEAKIKGGLEMSSV
jgi:hypothetical protein